MLTYLALTVGVLAILGVVLAVKRQANVTRSYTTQEQEKDAKVYSESLKAMEKTVEVEEVMVGGQVPRSGMACKHTALRSLGRWRFRHHWASDSASGIGEQAQWA